LLLLLQRWLFYWTSPLSTADIEVPGTPMVTAVVLSSHLEPNKNNKRGRNIPKNRPPTIQFDKGHVMAGRGRPPFQGRGSVPCDDVAGL